MDEFAVKVIALWIVVAVLGVAFWAVSDEEGVEWDAEDCHDDFDYDQLENRGEE